MEEIINNNQESEEFLITESKEGNDVGEIVEQPEQVTGGGEVGVVGGTVGGDDNDEKTLLKLDDTTQQVQTIYDKIHYFIQSPLGEKIHFTILSLIILKSIWDCIQCFR